MTVSRNPQVAGRKFFYGTYDLGQVPYRIMPALSHPIGLSGPAFSGLRRSNFGIIAQMIFQEPGTRWKMQQNLEMVGQRGTVGIPNISLSGKGVNNSVKGMTSSLKP